MNEPIAMLTLAVMSGVIVVSVLGWARATATAVRRRRRGQCAACGYPLTGSYDERCPECGNRSYTSENRLRR